MIVVVVCIPNVCVCVCKYTHAKANCSGHRNLYGVTSLLPPLLWNQGLNLRCQISTANNVTSQEFSLAPKFIF